MSSLPRRTADRDAEHADWTLDVSVDPEAALRMLDSSMNLPRRRALGLFKLRPEFVGRVDGDRFEVWERQRRAVHAIGRARRARGGGTRLEARFGLTRSARFLAAVFFPLYALAALGLASRPPDAQISGPDLAIAVAGGVVVAIIFVDSRRVQRRDLRAFLERVFSGNAR